MSDDITEDYVRSLSPGPELDVLCAKFMEDPTQYTLIDSRGKEPWGVRNSLKDFTEQERRWWLRDHKEAGNYEDCRFQEVAASYSSNPKHALRLLRHLMGRLRAYDGSCAVMHLNSHSESDIVNLSATGDTVEHSIALCGGIMRAKGVTKDEMRWAE